MRARWTISILLMLTGLLSQGQPGVRQCAQVPVGDTITLDTLSIVPSSLEFPEGLDSSMFWFDPFSARILLREGTGTGPVEVCFQSYPVLFTGRVALKDTSLMIQDYQNPEEGPRYVLKPALPDFFAKDGIRKTGSISRGIRFGNSQDLSFNSVLNLQMEGRIGNDLFLAASISDDNIPIQPDGTTAQLQEFDQVFIKVYNDRFALTGGDLWISRPKGYFANYNKRSQGVSASGVFSPFNQGESKLKLRATAGFSKGKFARNEIQGVEGNQGPYRLRGQDNEPYIIVLAGTEKVYIDGRQLRRGQEYEYIMDYNTSEITFTSNQMITKDRRIIVEFQYSDRSYARTLYEASGSLKRNAWEFWGSAYSEQDLKNQPLLIDLSAEQRRVLETAGDHVLGALASSMDSVGYTGDRVLYAMVDSLGYDSVLVVSNHPDSAHYSAIFSEVGQGNGDYVFKEYSALGRVYQWVAPIAGARQGTHAAVVSLVAPNKQQMVTAGFSYDRGKGLRTKFEASMTNRDQNTFSRLDGGNNTGFALAGEVGGNWQVGALDTAGKRKWTIQPFIRAEYVQRDFAPIERFRAVEFQRDWNLRGLQVYDQQLLANARFNATSLTGWRLGYGLNSLWWGDVLGLKNDADVRYRSDRFDLYWVGSVLNSQSETNTLFARHKTRFSVNLGPMRIGMRDEHELNRFDIRDSSGMLPESYQFYDWKVYVETRDTVRSSVGVYYQQRDDNRSDTVRLRHSAAAHHMGAYGKWSPSRQMRLAGRVTYRRLNVLREDLIQVAPDDQVLGRLEYSLKVWKQALRLNTYYEVGSGLELSREFIYVQVPAGQGTYTWIDYDQDGNKDLNEFEIAAFSDQADHIRVFVPSQDYVKIYGTQFSGSLELAPRRIWKGSDVKGMKAFLGRFSDQFRYRVYRKSGRNEGGDIFNPFVNDVLDSNLVSIDQHLSNNFFFNRTDPKFGADYAYTRLMGRSLLAGGAENRFSETHGLNARWNLTKVLTLRGEGEYGTKRSSADYVTGRDYDYYHYTTSPSLSYQPTTAFRAQVHGRYSYKKNDSDIKELAQVRVLGASVRWNQVRKGGLIAQFDYLSISYTGLEGTSLAFELLEGFRIGHNYSWSLEYRRNLGKFLQLNVNYGGRSSPGTKVVHTMGMEIRAMF